MSTQRHLLGISAIVRNEAPYLLEWIAHHRLLGAGRFFLIDDRSDDGTSELLASLERCGVVTLLPFLAVPGEKPQLRAYRELLRAFRNEVEWMAYIDIDEYIWPMGREPRISDFLNSLPPQVGAIALNWATFGSSGQLRYENLPTPERFTWHAQLGNPVNHNIKTVSRTACTVDFTCPHNATIDPAWSHVHTDLTPKAPLGPNGRPDRLLHCLSESVSWSAFRLNHYVIRSWEEYLNKKSLRGRAFTDYPLDSEFFSIHDFAEVQTTPPREYLSELKQEMRGLQALMPEVDWAAFQPDGQNFLSILPGNHTNSWRETLTFGHPGATQEVSLTTSGEKFLE